MEWFQNLLNKSSSNKSSDSNNNKNISNSTQNGNNNSNDMNAKDSNDNNDKNDSKDQNKNDLAIINDDDNKDDNKTVNIDDNNNNNNNITSIITPKKCYTLDELRRIEKRLGKIELPQEISEYVTSGKFRSISKNQSNTDRGGRKQGQGQGGQGQGKNQVKRETGQGQGQNNNNNNNNNNNGNNNNNYNKQGDDNNWSRNRQVNQDNYKNNNNNNNNNNYNNTEKKLSVAEQKLLFEQERRKILAEREKLNDEHDGSEPALQFRDETDLLLEELAGESNESQAAPSKGTKISFNSLLSSSEGDISHQHHAPVDSNGNSVVVQFSSLKTSKEEIPNQSDIWSSFLDPKLSPGNIFGESIFNTNGSDKPYGEAGFESTTFRKESRLGSILKLAPTPEKSASKLDRVDDDTLDLTNPAFFADTLPPSPNSKNNRLNVQSLFSAARQNPNNPSPDSGVEHKIIKSSDVLSRLGFEGQQNNDSTEPNNNSPTPPTPSNNSPFSFHGQDSAVKKGRKQAGGLSVASRMQLMKMQTGKKIENIDKTPIKSEAPPVQLETTPVKSVATPVKEDDKNTASPAQGDGLGNMKRINLNSLFVKP